MCEVRRILTSPKTILCFCVCLFLSCMFFAYECGIDKYITAEGDELTAYLEYYPDFLASVQENADSISAISSMRGKFASDSIAKTASDYAKLGGIELSSGENRGVVLYSNYFTADLLLAAFVLIVVSGFSEENKKHLGNLVRSTRYGRQHLSAQRAATIVIISLLFTFAVCIGCMTVSRISFGSANVFRPLQSIPEFRLCSMPVSIAGYLLLSCLLKAMAAAIIGLVTYLFSAVLDSIIAAVTAAVLVAAQYLSYVLIEPVDRIAALKFCNITALLRADVFFKNYLNLNFFGNAVGFLNAALMLFGLLLAITAALCIAFTSGRSGTHSIGEKLAEKIRRYLSKKELPKSLVMWELKKVFVSQKGLLILIGVLYIALFSSIQYRYVYTADPYLAIYYGKFAGIVTEEKTEDIIAARIEAEEKLIDLIARYEQAVAEENLDAAAVLYTEMMEAQNHYIALSKVESQAISALEYTLETGIDIELIKQDTYELLYIRDTGTTERNCMYILFAIIGMFAGIIAREKQTNILELQRSTKRGRIHLLASKTAILFVSCILVSLAVNAVQAVQLGLSAGYNDLGAPAQSLEFLRGMTTPMTIQQYMILIFALRALGAFAVGIAVMIISKFSKNTMTCVSICAAVLVIPALLDSLGLDFIISFIDLLSISIV